MKNVILLLTALMLAGFTAAQEKKFNAGKGGTLQTELSYGSLHVEVWDQNQVSVQGEDDDDQELKVTQQGDAIKVTGYSYGGDIYVKIPSSFNVKFKSGAGDLIIRGDLSGSLSVNTSGGDINTGNINGLVNILTYGGDIRLGNVSQNAELKTNGGDIRIGDVKGKANIETLGGNVNTGNITNSLSVSTAGGNIMVGSCGKDAALETGGGNVSIKSADGKISMSSGGGDIKLENAKGKVLIKTGAGNIRLKNITGEIKAFTGAGDIIAELNPHGNEISQLLSKNGNITLYISSNANATITAIATQWNWRPDEGESPENIRSDFKRESLQKDKDHMQIKAVYKIGSGQSKLELKSSNGEIEIRKK